MHITRSLHALLSSRHWLCNAYWRHQQCKYGLHAKWDIQCILHTSVMKHRVLFKRDGTSRLPKCDVSFLYYRFKVRVSKCISCLIWIYGYICPSRHTGIYWSLCKMYKLKVKQIKWNVILYQLWLSRFICSGTWHFVVFFSDKYQRSCTITKKNEFSHFRKFRAKWSRCIQFICNELQTFFKVDVVAKDVPWPS